MNSESPPQYGSVRLKKRGKNLLSTDFDIMIMSEKKHASLTTDSVEGVQDAHA